MQCNFWNLSWWSNFWNGCNQHQQSFYRDDDDLSNTSIFSTHDYISTSNDNDWCNTLSSSFWDNSYESHNSYCSSWDNSNDSSSSSWDN